MRTLCLMLSLIVSLFGLPARAEGEGNALFWRVSAPEGGTLYLYGTASMADERADELPGCVLDALSEADALAVPTDAEAFSADAAAREAYYALILLPKGDKTSRHLSEGTHADAKAFFTARGAYQDGMNRFSPLVWLSLIESALYEDAGLSDAHSVDAALIRASREAGLPVIELEGVERQTRALLALPDAALDDAIAARLDDPEYEAETLRAFYEAYIAGDEAEMYAFSGLVLPDDLPSETRALREAVNRAVNDDRNALLCGAALELMNGGKTVLLAAGASRMLGENGLPALLAREGCEVVRVPDAP